MKCPYCKKIKRKGWVYCPQCGKKYPIARRTIKTYRLVEPSQVDRIEEKIDAIWRAIK